MAARGRLVPGRRWHPRRARAAIACACATAVLVCASTASAQRKDDFGDALLSLVGALEGAVGDERPRIEAVLASLARGLAEWDRGIRNLERQIAEEAPKAAPDVAAQPRLEEAAARAPESSEIHRVLGNAHRMGRQHDMALSALETAIRLDSTNERAHLALASTLMEMGRAEEAALALRRAVANQPDSGQMHWMLARQ